MTPQQLKAMKQAIEALELNNSEWKDLADSGDSGYWKAEDQGHYQLTIEAITALEEALAEHAMSEVQRLGQEIEQEPVISKWVLREVYFDEDGEPIMHRSTPQRKPLTDEEIINKCLESGFERNCLGWSFTYGKLDYHLLKLARAIETKLKEKNHANGNT